MSDLPTVKAHRPKRSGKCPALAFILMAVLTPVGLFVGFWLAMKIAGLIHLDFILLTVFLVWMGAIIGATSGSAMGGHCRNMVAAFFATLPAGLLGLLLALGIADHYTPGRSDLFNAWTIAEAFFIAGTPLFVLHVMRDKKYCESCRKAYGENKTLWTSADHPADTVLSRLNAKSWEPPLAAGAKPDGTRDSVAVTADVCPTCFDAVVHANCTRIDGKKKEERLVYSDFWPGEQFKALVVKLGDSAK